MSFRSSYPNSLNILQVDNGRFHKGKGLVVPENIIKSPQCTQPFKRLCSSDLLFQPPYCPELNPIERLWEHLKAALKWAAFKTLAQLLDHLLAQLTPEVIASLTGYSFILDALSALNTV